MKANLFFGLCLLAICFTSCTKDLDKLKKNLYDCHNETTWDSTQIVNALKGEWEWDIMTCYFNPDAENEEEYAGISVSFLDNNQLEVKENGVVTQTLDWTVSSDNFGNFRIEMDPRLDYFYGYILICDNDLSFNNSDLDGCDNYFKLKK